MPDIDPDAFSLYPGPVAELAASATSTPPPTPQRHMLSQESPCRPPSHPTHGA